MQNDNKKNSVEVGKFLKSLFMPWEEVYSSTDLTEAMKRETLLSSHGIKFKATDDSLRLNMNSRGGSEGMALSRGGPQKAMYRILVRRDQAETARYHLYQNK